MTTFLEPTFAHHPARSSADRFEAARWQSGSAEYPPRVAPARRRHSGSYQPDFYPSEQPSYPSHPPERSHHPQNPPVPSAYHPGHHPHPSSSQHALTPRRYSNASASSVGRHGEYSSRSVVYPGSGHVSRVSVGSLPRQGNSSGGVVRFAGYDEDDEHDERRRERRREKRAREHRHRKPSMGDTIMMVWRAINDLISPRRHAR